MKLSEARAAYYEYSGKASDVTRALALAGIAIVWTFKVGEGASSHVDLDFLAPAFFLVVTLVFDFAQYAAAVLIWGIFHRHHEKKLHDLKKDPDVSAPGWLNWPALTAFWLKLLSVAIAYALLLFAIAHRWL